MKKMYFNEPCQNTSEYEYIRQIESTEEDIESDCIGFFNNKYQKSRIMRLYCNWIATFDKTLIMLITASLTSFSINIATNIISTSSSESGMEDMGLEFFQLFIALIFNVLNVFLTSIAIKTQESGMHFYLEDNMLRPDGKNVITNYYLNQSRKNIIFYYSMKNRSKIFILLILCIILALVLLSTFIFKNQFFLIFGRQTICQTTQ